MVWCAQRLLPCRPLHWVLKVSDLRASVNFYSDVFGLVVVRHEEFDVGCEATCNGPYSGWWSKTMMGFPSTGEDAFALELTYNYGVSEYKLGNDLMGIHVAVAGAADRARARGDKVFDTEMEAVKKVQNPDGQWFYLHEPTQAVAAATASSSSSSSSAVSSASAAPASSQTDPFLFVSLATTNLARARDFYRAVLGMVDFPVTTSDAEKLVPAGRASAMLGYTSRETKVQLVELPAGQSIDHGASFGRMAFGGFEVVQTWRRAVAAGDTVLNAPIALSTPGKASVTVTILADRDGNEICVVDDADFRRLSERKPGNEIINWEAREKRIKAQNKFQKAFGSN